ncbi:MAG: hypothetical protein RMJ67_05490, partial [Elusimicrobiota bacterium]|nr:hypothetical protein [Endomicrobiia bacterium]MDW8165943.1 hypothetical protein [Elusimicrobiota bacterium]
MKNENFPYSNIKAAKEVLLWGLEKFKEKVAIASSFSAEDVILIDMACKIAKEKNLQQPRIFTLDTGRLNQETY